MRATLMYGAGDVRVESVPDAHLIEPSDALVRVHRAAICGSDLWPYKSMEPSGDGRRMGHEIIGVVEDAKYRELREAPRPTIYRAMTQDDRSSGYRQYELSTDGPVSSLAPGVKRSVAEVDRSIAIDLTPLSDLIDASLTRDRLMATLSGFFGAVALVLAMVGLYGTLSYDVARRRNEIGIRIALGAARGRVVQLVLAEVAGMVVVGMVVGAAVALASTQLVRSLLYGLSASDPTTMAVSVVILAIVAVAAGAFPAWRAARVDPIAALREE